jgi:hypothetical protein
MTMNTLYSDGFVRDHTDSMLRDATRARLVRQAGLRRRSRRAVALRPGE